ncbi:hypothetical protein MMC30_006724 [Trapelia coarctata]|nr:hypothetical protein [Trapelia coarctata]
MADQGCFVLSEGESPIAVGYDTAIAKLREFSSLGHAENLLADVSRERRTDKSRPILFVGHSLGGLVIKQALIRSAEYLAHKQDANLDSIYQNTCGVIFFGTPHRGSDKAGQAHIIVDLAKLALRQPNAKLLRTLEEESDVLEHQRKSFASVTEMLPITCFYEEVPMGVVGMVVPERSACIDGFRVRTGGIPKNHTEMCKFASEKDIGYKRTLGHIHDIVDIVLEDSARKASLAAEKEKKRHAAMDETPPARNQGSEAVAQKASAEEVSTIFGSETVKNSVAVKEPSK